MVKVYVKRKKGKSFKTQLVDMKPGLFDYLKKVKRTRKLSDVPAIKKSGIYDIKKANGKNSFGGVWNWDHLKEEPEKKKKSYGRRKRSKRKRSKKRSKKRKRRSRRRSFK